jgi:rSAM/selenodomain-associated transferase 1
MLALSVFSKYWEPGQVKTRLARSVSDVTAANLHRLFLETTLLRLEQLGDERTIVYAPFDKGSEFEPLAGQRWRLEPQVQGSLGKRMEAHVQSTLRRKAHKIVLLGADCPHVSTQAIGEAFEQLDCHDAVLGPSEDGGYWLLGVKCVLPIFSGIPWGTPGVWKTTIDRLTSHDLTYHPLPKNFDIDELDDLKRLRKEIHDHYLQDDHLRSLARELRRVVDGG